MATLEFSDKHNIVAFLQNPTGSEDFHQIVDFLANSHIRYALTANPTIYASLIEQFWQTATVETVNNGEQQLSITVDGQTIAITKAYVRRHLQLADADGISSLPNTRIFEQLTLMGYISNDDKLTFQKGVHIPLFDSMLVHDQPGQDECPSSPEDEGPSLDAEDSPKHGRMIEEIDKDKTVNLVKSRELGKSHDTAEHMMESEHDDDDRTLAETLLNIKRSAAKGKAIMQESEPPKKIKKKEMIQISLDEEFAKSFYEEEQAQILQDEIYAKQVEAQWIADEERIPQEAKQTDEREKVINWNDPDVLRYHAVLNRPFSKDEVRKNMCIYLKNKGGYKMSHFKEISYKDIRPIFERVWDQNQTFVPKDSKIEKEVMKRLGFDLQQESSKKTRESRKKTLARKRAGEKQSKEEEFAMEIESLGTKYPIVDWKTHVLTENFMYYQIIKTDGGSKNYKIFSEMLDDFDRQDVMDLHRLVEERYATSIPEGCDLMLCGDLKILFQTNEEDEV
ncbi:hypothetical protein Tco_1508985 [Tanacetum coccineum]